MSEHTFEADILDLKIWGKIIIIINNPKSILYFSYIKNLFNQGMWLSYKKINRYSENNQNRLPLMEVLIKFMKLKFLI